MSDRCRAAELRAGAKCLCPPLPCYPCYRASESAEPGSTRALTPGRASHGHPVTHCPATDPMLSTVVRRAPGVLPPGTGLGAGETGGARQRCRPPPRTPDPVAISLVPQLVALLLSPYTGVWPAGPPRSVCPSVTRNNVQGCHLLAPLLPARGSRSRLDTQKPLGKAGSHFGLKSG